MKCFALFLAVNAPKGARNPLRHAEDDARRMRRFFTGALGGVPPECSDEILGPNAKRDGVLLYLSALALLPIENLVIFWCGHGNNAGIQLYDGILTYDEIRRALNQIRSRAKVLIMNTCRAGAARRVLEGRFGVAGVDNAMAVLRLAACPGVRLLAAVSDTESAHEDYSIGGSRFTRGLLHALHFADGDLAANGVLAISDERAMEGTTDFLSRTWPEEPLPELYGPIGECAPFPLAVSQVGFPVGAASIERCTPVHGPGVALVVNVYDRRHVRTFVHWFVTDAFGCVVADRRSYVDPNANAVQFRPQLRCDTTHLRNDPYFRSEVVRGRGIELNWTVQVRDGHGQVLDETVFAATYWPTQAARYQRP